MDTNNLLKQNNFQFKKKFGQNFITDQNLLRAIVSDAGIGHEDEVLEIGVGAGTLTKEIANAAKNVVCYEIDEKLKPILDENLKDFNNIEINFKDILKVEDGEINNKFTKHIKIVANLPYYITTPIIFKFLEGNFNIDSLTIMVQKEVAERLTAGAGSKNYGAITVQTNILADTKITRIVGRQMFNPAPNVDSAIVNIKINISKFDIKNLKLLKQIIKSAFHMRRKTLYNNLKQSLGLKPEQIKQAIISANFNESIRGEKLSPEDFVNLANEIEKIKTPS